MHRRSLSETKKAGSSKPALLFGVAGDRRTDPPHASVISYMEDALGVVARAERANVFSTYRAKGTLRWIGEMSLAGDSASA
jgi:hypothetical protein